MIILLVGLVATAFVSIESILYYRDIFLPFPPTEKKKSIGFLCLLPRSDLGYW